MRYLLIIIAVIALAVFAGAAKDSTDLLQDARAEYFAAMADGSLTGDALREAQLARIKAEAHGVQLQVERFNVDFGGDTDPDSPYKSYVYPHSVNQLVVPTRYYDRVSSYAKPGFYPNPVTAKGPDDLNAVCVPFGWDESCPGNYSYLVQYDEMGVARNYMIVAYGPTRDSSWDLDGDGKPEGVVIILSSGDFDWDNWPPLYDGGRILHLSDNMLDDADSNESTAAVAGTVGDPGKELQSDDPVTRAKQALTQNNLHAIQLALERWAVENAYYPQSVDQLVAPNLNKYHDERHSYIEPGFMDNPFDDMDGPDMLCIPLGWTTRAPGNFSYLVQCDEEGNVFGYQLVCYGVDPDRGLDIDGDGHPDGVLLYMGSGTEIVEMPDRPGSKQYYDSGRTVVID